jgi:hypothetical protein
MTLKKLMYDRDNTFIPAGEVVVVAAAVVVVVAERNTEADNHVIVTPDQDQERYMTNFRYAKSMQIRNHLNRCK